MTARFIKAYWSSQYKAWLVESNTDTEAFFEICADESIARHVSRMELRAGYEFLWYTNDARTMAIIEGRQTDAETQVHTQQ